MLGAQKNFRVRDTHGKHHAAAALARIPVRCCPAFFSINKYHFQ